MLNAGELLKERYRIVRLLGKGGLSYVYEVEDLILPKRWALKEFHPRNLSPEEMVQVREQFRREVELLSRLVHPRLPAISDSFTFNERDYMVMELIEGKTLLELIEGRAEPFPEAQVKEWTEEILDVLEYLHGQNSPVIYRDIKPQNIIISPEAGVRFIDFGIARLFNPVKEQDTIFMGTPGFSPPEQFRQRQTDCRSDIYSLGATMHYLLTLKDPGTNPFDFEPLSLSNKTVSPLMEKIVQKALEIKAEKRFQSATDMKKVLQGAMAFEDLFAQSFLILEPREIHFIDIDPLVNNEIQLVIKNSTQTPVKGTVTSNHKGLNVSPEHFNATLSKITVTPSRREFPRGEKVITSVVISTENNKTTVPVTVFYKPTFWKGLSPALASVIFFIIPVLSGLCWMLYLIEPAEASSAAVMILMALASLCAAFFLPSKYHTRSAVLLYLIILGAMIPIINGIPVIAVPQLSVYSGIIVTVFYFILVVMGINLILFTMAMRLSTRQKSEMRLVVVASFFIFPAMLFVLPFLAVIPYSLIFSNTLTFFIISSMLSLLFAVMLGYSLYRENREALAYSAPVRKTRYAPYLRLVTIIAIALLYGAFWFLLCRQFENLSFETSWLGSVPAFKSIVEWSVYLPFSISHLGEHAGRDVQLLVTFGAAALFAIFYVFLPRYKAPVKIGLFFLFLGVFLNLGLSFEVLHQRSFEKFRAILMTSPEKLLTDIAFPNKGFFDERLKNYYLSLAGAYKKTVSRNFTYAAQKFNAARIALPPQKKNSLLARKLSFLASQSRLWDCNDKLESLEFNCFDEELKLCDTHGSRDTLNLFSTDSESDILTGQSQFYIIPRRYFFFVGSDGKCREFQSDCEVLAVVRFYQGFLNEVRGKPLDGKRHFKEMEALLRQAGKTEVTELLRVELGERKSLYLRYPDLTRGKNSYYRELADFYRKKNNTNFALPLLIYQIEHFPATLFEKSEQVEMLYALGAKARGDALVDKLCKDESSVAVELGTASPEVQYLTAIKAGAERNYLRAYNLLTRLKDYKDFSRNPRYLVLYRNMAAAIRCWKQVITLSRELSTIKGYKLNADDYLKWAWSHDIIGEYDKAKPYYEKYAALMSSVDAKDPRLAIVKNRLAGGPIPTYVILSQLRINPERHRIVIFGEGIPPEQLPEVITWNALKDKPVVTLSDNITLKKISDFTMKNYKSTYHEIIFKNPEEEKAKKSYRFYAFYEYDTASYYPRKIAVTNNTIFNCKFVKDDCFDNRLKRSDVESGLYQVRWKGHVFVVVPRFTFDGPVNEDLKMVLTLQQSGFNEDYHLVFPDELFDLFNSEKGTFTDKEIVK
ncbi:MAG: protein kinase [Vulcanimicrobiota bacterium]